MRYLKKLAGDHRKKIFDDDRFEEYIEVEPYEKIDNFMYSLNQCVEYNEKEIYGHLKNELFSHYEDGWTEKDARVAFQKYEKRLRDLKRLQKEAAVFYEKVK